MNKVCSKQLQTSLSVWPSRLLLEISNSTGGGVFDGHCGAQLDHGVAAVGYGTTNGLDYILVKNSWGEEWGERYIRMKGNAGEPEGLSGINRMASFPTKTK